MLSNPTRQLHRRVVSGHEGCPRNCLAMGCTEESTSWLSYTLIWRKPLARLFCSEGWEHMHGSEAVREEQAPLLPYSTVWLDTQCLSQLACSIKHRGGPNTKSSMRIPDLGTVHQLMYTDEQRRLSKRLGATGCVWHSCNTAKDAPFITRHPSLFSVGCYLHSHRPTPYTLPGHWQLAGKLTGWGAHATGNPPGSTAAPCGGTPSGYDMHLYRTQSMPLLARSIAKKCLHNSGWQQKAVTHGGIFYHMQWAAGATPCPCTHMTHTDTRTHKHAHAHAHTHTDARTHA